MTALADVLVGIRDRMSRGQYPNEASVCTGIVLPILQELGWPVFDPQIVAPEFTVEGRRVDYALCHPRSKPIVFVEVKQIGHSDGADRQLFEYSFHLGVPLAVLTDGREWHFYLPAEQGLYQERRVYRLDILERETDESAARFRRYLDYTRICAGAAIEAAREDYVGVRRNRIVEATIPRAWQDLLEEQDSLLVELIADQVESLCGFKPGPDEVCAFLGNLLQSKSLPASPRKPPKGNSGLPHLPRNRSSARTKGDAELGFQIKGSRVQARSARDVLVRVFEELADRDPEFLDRFVSLPKHGRNRRYVARSRDELYPGRPDLGSACASEIRPGWYVGTNYGTKQIEKILTMACEVAGLRMGRDVKLWL